MNLKDISTQLLFTTVPIWVSKGEKRVETGTGFIFNAKGPGDTSVPLLVTNRHVVEGGQRGVLEVAQAKGGEPISGDRVRVEFDRGFFQEHLDPKEDLAAIPVAGLFREMQARGREPFYRAVDPGLIPTDEQLTKLAALEELVFVGYPKGMRDETSKLPIIRRGISATPVWNPFGGKERFLIDAGVYPGSSGSPVFILNQGAYPTPDGLTIGSRVHFIGVLAETIRSASDEDGKAFLGLGSAINSRYVRKFAEEHVQRLLEKTTPASSAAAAKRP